MELPGAYVRLSHRVKITEGDRLRPTRPCAGHRTICSIVGSPRGPHAQRITDRFSLGTPIEGSGPQVPPPPNSKTVTVAVDSSIPPPPDPHDPVAEPFFKAWQDCTQGVLGHKRDAVTASACKQSADLAAQFHPNQRFIERRSADVYAATALANAGNYEEALPYANKAVEVVEAGHDDNSGCNAAYSTREPWKPFSAISPPQMPI